MHSKRPDVVTEHGKQSSEHLPHVPEPCGRSQGSSSRSLYSSAAATHSPPDPTAQEMDESSIPAALVSKSSGLLVLLLPGCPVRAKALRHCPCPVCSPAPPWVPCAGTALARPWGLCAAGVARTALKQPPALLLCITIFTRCAPLQPEKGPARRSGRLPVKQRCAVTAAGVVPYCPGKELGCCSCARGMKPPGCRELAQHPCDNMEQTRWSTRLSRECLN